MAKPRESPTSAGAGSTSPNNRYQVGVVSLLPLAKVEDAETLYMYEVELLCV
jgi:hypothetical protein